MASTTEPQETNSAQKEQWRQLGVHTYIRIAIVGTLLYWLFHKEVGGIVYQWLTDSSWSHGFLIPLFSLYFLNQSKQEILNTRTKPSYAGLLLLVGVILFYVFNTVTPAGYGYFRQISAVGALGAVVLFLGGWPLLKHTWLPVIYLLFAIPLPDEILRSATIPMRLWAASVSTGIFNLFPNLEAIANGVVIELVYKGQPLEPPLDVAEACSGMRLLMTFFALGVAMAYLHYRPAWQRLVLLASTVPIAIICNIVRVSKAKIAANSPIPVIIIPTVNLNMDSFVLDSSVMMYPCYPTLTNITFPVCACEKENCIVLLSVNATPDGNTAVCTVSTVM